VETVRLRGEMIGMMEGIMIMGMEMITRGLMSWTMIYPQGLRGLLDRRKIQRITPCLLDHAQPLLVLGRWQTRLICFKAVMGRNLCVTVSWVVIPVLDS
jgi:hypothetical protein